MSYVKIDVDEFDKLVHDFKRVRGVIIALSNQIDNKIKKGNVTRLVENFRELRLLTFKTLDVVQKEIDTIAAHMKLNEDKQ